MSTIIIEIRDPAAYQRLHELEELHLIHVMEPDQRSPHHLAKQFAGKLPAAIADDLQNHIKRSRNQWNNI